MRDLVVVVETPGPVHHRQVDAGLLQLGDVLDRQEMVAALVGRPLGAVARQVHGLGIGLPLLELPAAGAALQRVAGVVVAALPLVVGGARVAATGQALEKARQGGRRHAQELHVDLGGVHGGHRQAAVLPGRQHRATAGEVMGRRRRRGGQLAMGDGRQRDAVDRFQSLPRLHAVAPLRLHAGEAQHPCVLGLAPVAAHALPLRRGAGRGRCRRGALQRPEVGHREAGPAAALGLQGLREVQLQLRRLILHVHTAGVQGEGCVGRRRADFVGRLGLR
jgi:hypothetical protein